MCFVRNLPGAEGITAMNYVVQQVAPDGATIVTAASTTADPLNYRKPQAHFDPTAFELPPSGKKGNLAKNLIEGPGFAQLDLGISKVFDLPRLEKYSLEFRSEFFNILNHPNFTFAERNLIPGAEKITGAYDGRSIQFALKYLF